ncbi:hypothetical protein [Actinokineospora sp. NBRC 105648]|uniref:hypothetical protein n=1 Tax=Actinokineospora sp. NBRC 105648 TaxID=3032206 RepID=UPI0024A051B3|nr:hypothetical protein [Actinokineospora sp. NBRC 105648]GLZ42402.1 hypothetical protein Acsp05_60260 [Actinokineospora sp. NBRC 105648]
MADDIEVGRRVVVPFGLHDIEGLVVRVSKTGPKVWVTVDLDIEGADEHLVTTYPIEVVRTTSAA